MAAIFLGVNNASTVQPIVDSERSISQRRARARSSAGRPGRCPAGVPLRRGADARPCRERAAGYYAAYPFAAAQALIELPYLLVQAVLFRWAPLAPLPHACPRCTSAPGADAAWVQLHHVLDDLLRSRRAAAQPRSRARVLSLPIPEPTPVCAGWQILLGAAAQPLLAPLGTPMLCLLTAGRVQFTLFVFLNLTWFSYYGAGLAVAVPDAGLDMTMMRSGALLASNRCVCRDARRVLHPQQPDGCSGVQRHLRLHGAAAARGARCQCISHLSAARCSTCALATSCPSPDSPSGSAGCTFVVRPRRPRMPPPVTVEHAAHLRPAAWGPRSGCLQA